MNFFVENAWIIAALPLWAFLLITIGRNLSIYSDKKISTYITTGATFAGLVCSIFILVWSLNTHEPVYQHNMSWLAAGNINFSIGWLIDRLSAMMLIVVTSVSILIQVYSHGYMSKDEGFHRFFSYLALFNFSMLGLVLSSNLFQIYIFWELVGLSSYLLIGFWFRRPSAADAAKKAFIMNRIGDFGLLIGIMAFLFYSLNWWTSHNEVFLAFTALPVISKEVLKLSGPLIYSLIAFAIFLGPVAKSAQFPLHTWLPDAMEGPTPISALIHAATMVAAGVFLIARVYPIFQLSPEIMNIISWTGAITALIAASIAITQLDIKRVLAYSTCSQLGLMVLAMGVGAYSAGLFHLMTHAYFKAMLFLCSGAVIHGLTDQQDMRYMGGLRKKMPAVAYTYLIGTLSISGVLLSGFWSKDEIFAGIAQSGNWILLAVAFVVSGMTAFYMFRSYFMTFEGEYRGHAHAHNSPSVMTIPLIFLAVPSAIIGFILSGKLETIGIGGFSNFISISENTVEHSELAWLPFISFLVSVSGVLLAATLYWDKFGNILSPDKIKSLIKPLYNLSFNKWYIDNAYNQLIKRLVLPISDTMSWFDKNIIDGIVNLTGYIARLYWKIYNYMHNGNLQSYTLYLFGGFTIITFSILIYWLF